MSDYIPEWTALGVGVAEGEKQRKAKQREASAAKDETAPDDSASDADEDR